MADPPATAEDFRDAEEVAEFAALADEFDDSEESEEEEGLNRIEEGEPQEPPELTPEQRLRRSRILQQLHFRRNQIVLTRERMDRALRRVQRAIERVSA